MSEVREIESAVEHFASNQEFIRLYNRHNRELLLQHFLLIAAAGNEVWTSNHERKMSMPEQRDLMLVKYIEWLEKMGTEFPEVEKPFDVSEEWWRLMLLAYERKPISGKSLWRKFKEDTRNPILSSFNCHWAEPRDGETLEDRFKVVRRGVWSDLGHRLEEFIPEGSWLPKQWYAWRFCCYPGKNFRAFDGKLPTVSSAQTRHRHTHSASTNNNNNNNNSGFISNNSEVSMNWPASLPIDASGLHDPTSSSVNNGLDGTASLLMHHRGNLTPSGNNNSSSNLNNAATSSRANRSTLPSTVANQRLLQAAASMSRVRNNPEDELNVQHYLADVQQYMAQMTRLEKAVALAEAFGEEEKAVGFKRQLYEHVQTEPPGRLKRMNSGLLPLPLPVQTVAASQAGGVAVSNGNNNNNNNNQLQHVAHALHSAGHNAHNGGNNSMNNNNNNLNTANHLHDAMVNLPTMLNQQQQQHHQQQQQQHHHLQVQQQQHAQAQAQAQHQQQQHQQQQQQQRSGLSSTTSSGASSLADSSLQQL